MKRNKFDRALAIAAVVLWVTAVILAVLLAMLPEPTVRLREYTPPQTTEVSP